MSGVHAKASPSGAEGWMGCLQWEGGGSSPYAREGSCKHLVAAECLNTNKEAEEFVGEVFEIDGEEVEFSEKMVDATQAYVDQINELKAGHTLIVEGKINITALTGEPGAFGTTDAILIPDKGDYIAISDAKFGYRLVSPENNKQLKIYALAVLERYGMTGDYKRVVLRIHHPALNSVLEWECSVDDLTMFAGEVKTAAAAYLDPGKPVVYTPSDAACEWCAKLAVCPARRELIVSDTQADFEDLTKELPVFDDVEFLGKAMSKVPMIETWCKAVRGKIEANLLIGVDVPGFKIVQGKKGRREWADKDVAEESLRRMRLKIDEMYDKKIKSPTKMEKILADNPLKWERLQELITQKQGKPSVAPVSDPRPAMVIDPSADFTAIGELK